MFGVQIIQIINKDKRMKKMFGGIFPVDVQPKFTKNESGTAVIINSKKAGTQDGHWILVTKKKGVITFFDPLGQPIDKYSKKWTGWFKSKSTKIKRNTRAVQPFHSYLCGCYCLFALYKFSIGFNLAGIMKCFSSIKAHNDVFISAFMWNQFKLDVKNIKPDVDVTIPDLMLLLSSDKYV